MSKVKFFQAMIMSANYKQTAAISVIIGGAGAIAAIAGLHSLLTGIETWGAYITTWIGNAFLFAGGIVLLFALKHKRDKGVEK